MEQPQKLFTVEEANRAVGEVTPLIEQLHGLQGSLRTTNNQLDQEVQKLSVGNGHPPKEVQAHIEQLTRHQLDLMEAFQSALQQLQDLGCVLKDLDAGLVDFYSMRQEELVFLCWRVGEERIRFWHRLEEGFSGRQPLDG